MIPIEAAENWNRGGIESPVSHFALSNFGPCHGSDQGGSGGDKVHTKYLIERNL
jgi:hypothetical protein